MTKTIKESKLLLIAVGILLICSVTILIYTENTYNGIEKASIWVRDYFGKFYLYLGLFCVLFLVGMALSPLGSRKLGKSTDTPEFSRWAWIAMLYSAGMGAGILLRAVQEPVFMSEHPPIIITGQKNNLIALEYTFYHWGFTAWAFYGLFALIIGYYVFSKDRPALISASIQNLSKNKLATGVIDILAIITTVFGLVGAIGLGTTQINGGINHLSSYEFDVTTVILITLLIYSLAFISVWKGMHRGIKRLSTFNILITLAIFLFIFFQGDVVGIISAFAKALYHYILDFIPISLALGRYNPGETFLTDWTYYYWAFWIAWAPFTGIFIARISRGRSIREILLGVLIIPSLGTFLWFSVFGESAFQLIESWTSYEEQFSNVFSSIFIFFENYPFAGILNSITIILLISFLVTSVDSAIFVLSMFTDKGNPQPSKKHRLVWSVTITILTITIITLSTVKSDIDILVALQKLLIVTSLPFALFMILMALIFIVDITKNNKLEQRN